MAYSQLFLSQFDYSLPAERIAQTPIAPRDASRMMYLNRASGEIRHHQFRDLPRFLRSGDLLVFNDTRVLPARLYAQKLSGGRLEILLLKEEAPTRWRALLGGRRMVPGTRFRIPLKDEKWLDGHVVALGDGAERVVEFSLPLRPFLAQIGQIPLPPYIQRRLIDQERYQTVYAQKEASSAAPTAGLHFTETMLKKLQGSGIQLAYVTLQVGMDTFAPVKVEDLSQHHMHSEYCELPAVTAELINRTRKNGGRVVAIGTTAVRTLESAAAVSGLNLVEGEMQPFGGDTRLFIAPGYQWRVVNAMLTNFHLPKSTLLMLVSAFCEPNGIQKLLRAYQVAIAEEYRFFSFGDCMWLARE